MALHRWRTAPALFVENRETGDGRVFAPGAVTFDAMPQPLAWARDGDQHVDLLTAAPQVGIIEDVARDGDVVTASGVIDDEIPDGAELVRRMRAGTASHGTRQGVSIDPDNWTVEVIAATDEAEVLMVASGSGRFPTGQELRRADHLFLGAAAGDPDPGKDGGERGSVVFVDGSDAILARFTRARLRGATAVAVPAFTDAMIELEQVAAEPDGVDETPADDDAVTATTRPAVRALRALPLAGWFDLPEPDLEDGNAEAWYGVPADELVVEQPDGQYGVPLRIVERDDGLHQVFGNVALWGTCHTGYLPDCVTPPDSPSAYAHFHVGEVRCADGARRATGPLTVGTDHAAARLLAPEARDHYANTGLAFADVRASSGVMGPWVAGVCRPLSEDQLAAVRASSLSGDWRRVGGALELIGALAVNVPGFPIAREAAAGPLVAAAGPPTVGWADGAVVSLVAAGIVQRCPECAERARLVAGTIEGFDYGDRLDAIDDVLAVIERRTRHMTEAAAGAALARIRNGH